MARTGYSYPALLEPQRDRSVLARFPDLPEALTDGATEAEALADAADCLSEALAGRIRRGEPIPVPSRGEAESRLITPDPMIALKTALYAGLKKERITVADLARRLGIEERKAARLLDPRAASRLPSLERALAALGYEIGIEVREKSVA